MSEELKVNCFECKDLEFARNLARSMKEGYGRHNSNRSFRTVTALRRAGFRYISTPQDSQDALALAWYVLRENQQARIIGRIGDHALRERWQDCEIGDAVPESKFEHGLELHELCGVMFIDKVIPRTPWGPDDQYGPTRRLSFERVGFTVTHDHDQCSWQTEYVWKRIS